MLLGGIVRLMAGFAREVVLFAIEAVVPSRFPVIMGASPVTVCPGRASFDHWSESKCPGPLHSVSRC